MVPFLAIAGLSVILFIAFFFLLSVPAGIMAALTIKTPENYLEFQRLPKEEKRRFLSQFLPSPAIMILVSILSAIIIYKVFFA